LSSKFCCAQFYSYSLISKFIIIKLNEADSDGSGSIEFPEFLNLMALHTNQNITAEEIREAFRVFDKNLEGKINCIIF
jgi:Ca2+-binding EF-hand superfamily protein